MNIAEKNVRRIKFNIYSKIIFLEILVIAIMKFLTPVLLNYPPMSEEAVFQSQIEPFSHTMQYISLGSLAVIIYILCIHHMCKSAFKFLDLYVKDKSKITTNLIKKVRKDCFIIPKKIILVQVVILVVILLMLFIMLKANVQLCFKFLLVYFAFFTVIAIISSVLIKQDLDIVIKLTYNIDADYSDFKKQSNFKGNLLFNLFPFFLVIIIIISLLGYAKGCSAIGEGNYNYYKFQLQNTDFNNLSKEELIKKLDDVTLKNPNDYYFIIDNGETYISDPNGNLSDFFLKYLNTYYEQTDGRIYEYYGVEEEGYAQRIFMEDHVAYIGFKYSSTTSEFGSFFVYLCIISLIIYAVILVVWSRGISQNLIEVTNNLVKISKGKVAHNIGVLPVTSDDELGQLTVAFNDIQKITKANFEKIRENQDLLMEKERLASLGQLIGGIAHNLKTPIMSISGAAEGLNDLIKEYDSSIDDPEVNSQDHHDIAKDMSSWIEKIKTHTEYMSDVITAVKGQAVNLSNEEDITFTVGELLKRVNILMKHELKNAIVYLNISLKVDENLILKGDVNSLVQVINNMISNSIQAYNGKPDQNIDLIVTKENNNLLISVKDYASGLSQEAKDKLFKEMFTTKGKNGTGLGLYMSYSTIRAHFNGNITFESEEGRGTTFIITLPIN